MLFAVVFRLAASKHVSAINEWAARPSSPTLSKCALKGG